MERQRYGIEDVVWKVERKKIREEAGYLWCDVREASRRCRDAQKHGSTGEDERRAEGGRRGQKRLERKRMIEIWWKRWCNGARREAHGMAKREIIKYAVLIRANWR